MFDINNAIDQWCDDIGSNDGEGAELREELKDHLYCEIEILQKEGLTDQQAFNLATKKLGKPNELLSEYKTNRKLFSKMCSSNEPSLNEYSQQRSNVMTYKQSAKRLIGQAIIWAAAVLSSALILGESEQYFTYLLLLTILATMSLTMNPGFKEMARIEARFICRLLGLEGK